MEWRGVVRRWSGLLKMAVALAVALVAAGPLVAQEKAASGNPRLAGARSGEAGTGDKEGEKAGEEPVRFEPGVRLHTIWQYSDYEGTAGNDFSVGMARLGLRWEVGRMVDGKVSADLEQLFTQKKLEKGAALLRDAYVRVRPLKYVGIRLGQFKRPFSGLELRSRAKLETVGRGIGNGLLVEDLGFGDRDIGIMLEGKVGGKKRNLKYRVGAFNGGGADGGGANAKEADLDGSKDLVFRVEGNPIKWLTVGANASMKWFDTAGQPFAADSAMAAGLDVRFKRKGLAVYAEWMAGQSWNRCDYAEFPVNCRLEKHTPYAWGGLLMGTYEWKLPGPWNLALAPVFRGEYLVPAHDVTGTGVGQFVPGANGAGIWQLVPGLNLHIGDYFRVMADGECTLVQEKVPDGWTEKNWADGTRFLVQFALDI